MSATALLASLERLGVRLRAEDGRLVVDAPRGVLTDAVKAELRARKPELPYGFRRIVSRGSE